MPGSSNIRLGVPLMHFDLAAINLSIHMGSDHIFVLNLYILFSSISIHFN